MNNDTYTLFPTTTYKKDLKKYKNNSDKLNSIFDILDILMEKGSEGIPANKRPHPLTGNYKGALECHIEPDLLLIWTEDKENKEITLQRIGSHSELFS
mgnify:CR=1 FL=1|jgi:addiction module toxin, relE/stbE family